MPAVIGNPAALATIVCTMSALFAWLADPADAKQYLKIFIVSVAFLLTLMGLGAVFGKTLGDFLRNVNGSLPALQASAGTFAAPFRLVVRAPLSGGAAC